MDWGAAFDRQPNGEVALAREAAHSVRRVLHARDTTGRTIGGTLWARTAAHPRIHAVEHARATAILVEDGRAVGVEYLDPDGTRRTARARATLLATGGAGQVFRETTNPEVASGDGIAMAWAAGARVADLEFVQFHPTALQVEGQPRFLLSEALRGEGARLVNADGEPFMTRYEDGGRPGAARSRVARPSSASWPAPGGRCSCRCSTSTRRWCTPASRTSPPPAAPPGSTWRAIRCRSARPRTT